MTLSHIKRATYLNINKPQLSAGRTEERPCIASTSILDNGIETLK